MAKFVAKSLRPFVANGLMICPMCGSDQVRMVNCETGTDFGVRITFQCRPQRALFAIGFARAEGVSAGVWVTEEQ